jgi:PAS domain S-box-containing protein
MDSTEDQAVSILATKSAKEALPMLDQSLPRAVLPEPSAFDDPQIQANEIARLQALVQLQQDIIDTMPLLVCAYTVVSRTEYRMAIANRASRQMSGFDNADLVGTSLTDVLSPEDAAKATQWFQKCLDANTAVEAEERYIFPSGTVWTRTTYIPMHDSNGHIARILLIVRDITAEKQRQLEEQQYKEEIIEQQSAALAELSTPLLTISDTTVVMPLVGTVDSRRVGQIMEALLEGVSASRASIVILDITGVAMVDTQVANAFIRASQAVSLLGAQVVLTGIRPEVAQTLVQLGVDFRGIVTRGTLQDGITYALRN